MMDIGPTSAQARLTDFAGMGLDSAVCNQLNQLETNLLEEKVTYETAFFARVLFKEMAQHKNEPKLEDLAQKVMWTAVERNAKSGLLSYLSKVCSAIKNFFVHWDFKEMVSSDYLLLQSLDPERMKNMLDGVAWQVDTDHPHDGMPADVSSAVYYDLVAGLKTALSKEFTGREDFTTQDLEEIGNEIELIEAFQKKELTFVMPPDYLVKPLTPSDEAILEKAGRNLEKAKREREIFNAFQTKEHLILHKVDKLASHLKLVALQSYLRINKNNFLQESRVSVSRDSVEKKLVEDPDEEIRKALQSCLVTSIRDTLSSLDKIAPDTTTPSGSRVMLSPARLLVQAQLCGFEKDQLIDEILTKFASLDSLSLIATIVSLKDQQVDDLAISDEALKKFIASCAERISQAEFTEEIAEKFLDMVSGNVVSRREKAASLFGEELKRHPATQEQVDQLSAVCKKEITSIRGQWTQGEAEDKFEWGGLNLSAAQKEQVKAKCRKDLADILETQIERLRDWRIKDTTILVKDILKQQLRELKEGSQEEAVERLPEYDNDGID